MSEEDGEKKKGDEEGGGVVGGGGGADAALSAIDYSSMSLKLQLATLKRIDALTEKLQSEGSALISFVVLPLCNSRRRFDPLASQGKH
jgi:hypothetical protein